MSYCRWSSDDYRCDLYIYESDGGLEVHFARSRHTLTDKELPAYVASPGPGATVTELGEWAEAYAGRLRAVHELLENAERVPIGGAYDGESMAFSDEEELLTFLLTLREDGTYQWPESVETTLKQEIWEKKLSS